MQARCPLREGILLQAEGSWEASDKEKCWEEREQAVCGAAEWVYVLHNNAEQTSPVLRNHAVRGSPATSREPYDSRLPSRVPSPRDAACGCAAMRLRTYTPKEYLACHITGLVPFVGICWLFALCVHPGRVVEEGHGSSAFYIGSSHLHVSFSMGCRDVDKNERNSSGSVCIISFFFP